MKFVVQSVRPEGKMPDGRPCNHVILVAEGAYGLPIVVNFHVFSGEVLVGREVDLVWPPS